MKKKGEPIRVWEGRIVVHPFLLVMEIYLIVQVGSTLQKVSSACCPVMALYAVLLHACTTDTE